MTKKCQYAKSDMTPCVIKDGPVAFCFGDGNEPICVGCERGPNKIGVPRPADWDKTIKDYTKTEQRRNRRR